MLRLILPGLLLLSACAPSADPQRQASLDAWSTAIEDKDVTHESADEAERPRLAVGQWVEYRMKTADGATAVRQLTKIVGQEGDNFWIEHEIEEASGWSMRAALGKPNYDQVLPVNIQSSRSLVQVPGRAAFPKEPDAPLPITFDPANLRDASLDEIEVPAGSFKARKIRVIDQPSGQVWGTQWFHEDVPIYGSVLMNFGGGGQSELVGFGMTGARSNIVELAAKQLERDLEAFGEKHPETLKSMSSLAYAYRIQGSFEEAEQLYRKALDISRQELGGKHADTILITYKLAFLYDNLGRHEESGRLWAYLHAFEKLWKDFPSISPLNAELVADIVELYRVEGRDPANRGGVEIDSPLT